MHTSSTVAAALFALALPSSFLAQNPIQPLLDLEPGPAPVSSAPTPGAELHGVCIFAATTRAEGRELWRTSPSGPQLLKDIFPGALGASPAGFTVFQGRVWFAANDGVHGNELWATDGTAAGTVMVADLEPGLEGSAPAGFTVCGSQLFFTAFEAGAGREPHVTDGTTAGSGLVADVRPGRKSSAVEDTHRFSCCGNQVLFVADDGSFGAELHKSDGTAAGTAMVVDLRPGFRDGVSRTEAPVCCNGKLLFSGDDGTTGFEPFVSDGTAAGTVLLQNLRLGGASSFPSSFFCYGNAVLFSADSSANGREPFLSDGTPGGTALLADIQPGTRGSFPGSFAQFGSLAAFAASAPNLGAELFATDGTTAGTALLVDVRPGISSSFPRNLTACNSLLFFTAQDADGNNPYVTDGTAGGTTRLADVFPGQTSDQPKDLLCCGNRVLMSAPTAQGVELLETDGTPAGTAVHDLEPALTGATSRPREITPIDGVRFYFVATTSAHGSEVFFFDGRIATPLDLVPGTNGSSPRDLTAVDDTVYWSATTPATGREVFRSRDGGPAELVADLRPGTASASPREFVALDGDTLVFVAATGLGTELCEATNGVAGVTVHDLNPTGSSFASGLSRIRDAVTGTPAIVFAADDGVHGQEPFAFERGRAQQIVDLNQGPSGSSPFGFSVSPDGFVVAFAAFDGNGNTAKRVVFDSTTDFFSLDDLVGSTLSYLIQQVAANHLGEPVIGAAVLIENNFSAIGTEVHVVDDQGLMTPIDVFPGAESSNPDNLTFLGGNLGFLADDGDHGTELFTYDLTNQTLHGHDLKPGHESSNPQSFVQLGDGDLMLEVEPVASGHQRLVRIHDHAVQPLQAQDWTDPRLVGPRIVFAGDDGVHGSELMLHTEPRGSVFPLGAACNGDALLTATTPRVGQSVLLEAIGGPLNAVGVMFVDLVPSFTSLPILGCDVWVGLPTALAALVTISPDLRFVLPVPNDPLFIDAAFLAQASWIDLSFAVIATSNGVAATIGQ